MRFLGLLLLVLASSIAPAAQQRFIQACVESMEGEDLGGADVRSICTCAAETSVNRGISAASLDGLMNYVGPDGNLNLDSAPAPVQALSEVVVQGLFTCVFESIDSSMATALRSEEAVSGEPAGRARTHSGGGPLMARPRREAGTGRQASQAGRGATVRIRG